MIIDQIQPRREYTITDLFNLVMIGERTFYRALRSGELKGFKRGYGHGMWIIYGYDFVEWYTNRTHAFFYDSTGQNKPKLATEQK